MSVVRTASERKMSSRIGGLMSWANEQDPTGRAQRMQEGLLARFEREADPDGKLDPAERRRRAELLRKAHMTRLALKSAKARRKRTEAA